MDPNARPTTRANRAARRAQRSFLDNVENDNTTSVSSADGVPSATEEIDDDDLCPICQMLLHEPVTTTCRHTLCRFCMATWASTSQEAPMKVPNVPHSNLSSAGRPARWDSSIEIPTDMDSTLPRDCSRAEYRIARKHTNYHSPHRQPPHAHPTTCRRTGREPARVGLLRETLSHRHHQGGAYPPPSHFPPESHRQDTWALFYITHRLGPFHHYNQGCSQVWLQLGVRRCGGLARRCSEGEFAARMDSGF